MTVVSNACGRAFVRRGAGGLGGGGLRLLSRSGAFCAVGILLLVILLLGGAKMFGKLCCLLGTSSQNFKAEYLERSYSFGIRNQDQSYS